MSPASTRKRLRQTASEAAPIESKVTRGSKRKAVALTPRKPTLFDAIDAGTSKVRTPEQSKAALEKLAVVNDSDSSLSSLNDDEFENVPIAKRQKVEEDSSDEDVEFEDIPTHVTPELSRLPPSGDLELTLRKDPRISLTNPHGTKKGPSNIERGIRITTHKNHVKWLMMHNAIRNSWLCDQELQAILISQLPPVAVKEVDKWRRSSGLGTDEEENPKSKGKDKKAKTRNQSDWSEAAKRLENQTVDKRGIDPIFRLLTMLSNVWRRRFRITAPGLRKLGYMSLETLDGVKKSFDKDEYDPEIHGERIKDISEFRHSAQTMEGSRDLSAQLFTALLRGLGIEARMVASLQTVGFGWNQNEEALEKNPRKLKERKSIDDKDLSGDDDSSDEEEEVVQTSTAKRAATLKSKHAAVSAKNSRKSGVRDSPIDLSDSEDASVVDITPAKQRLQPSIPYDKDLTFPHYWTEVLSPVTNVYTAVDPVVLNLIATKPEILSKFEPRGSKADKAKQVVSYIIGHSPDGSAKDVTTRYLKRQMWPGRTKGNRIPPQEVTFTNSHGELIHFGEVDWFKEVMSSYVRGSHKCPRTDVDEKEDQTDLKPQKPEKKVVEDGKETLQSYKSSSEFVLERHLKRDEATTAKHVKTFAVKSKGEEVQEKVFLRKDIVSCKSSETWHKEGRAPKPGEAPLKHVPHRAATLNRTRQLAEAEQATGEKLLQGLYSLNQTQLITPPAIRNGIIPKNDYGNIDLFVETMLPKGAVHIPLRGTVKICKQLGIDYAEAVTGFEFGNRFAVPVISGVVIATEHYEDVMEIWAKDEEERVRKEDEKRTRVALATWKKFIMQWRIRKYVEEKYGGEEDDEVDMTWTSKKGKASRQENGGRSSEQRDVDMAGGFLPDAQDDDDEDDNPHLVESFFPHHEHDDDEGGGFIVE